MKSSNENPFFSIIIPTYNRGYIIEDAINSIINQTFDDWELIIIDDGSEDDTAYRVKNYKDDRIRYFWQENQERSIARNNGILKAKGEWICFLDSDDQFTNNILELYNQNINDDTLIIRSQIQIVTENNEIIKLSPHYENGDILRFIIESYDSVLHYCFHRTIFKEFKFYPISRWEDQDLLIRIISKGYSVQFLNEISVIALHHDQRSIFSSPSSDEVKEVISRMIDTLKESDLSINEINKIITRQMKSFIITNLADKGLLSTILLVRNCKYNSHMLSAYSILKYFQNAIR